MQNHGVFSFSVPRGYATCTKLTDLYTEQYGSLDALAIPITFRIMALSTGNEPFLRQGQGNCSFPLALPVRSFPVKGRSGKFPPFLHGSFFLQRTHPHSHLRFGAYSCSSKRGEKFHAAMMMMMCSLHFHAFQRLQ